MRTWSYAASKKQAVQLGTEHKYEDVAGAREPPLVATVGLGNARGRDGILGGAVIERESRARGTCENYDD